MAYTLTDNAGSAFGLGTVISEDSSKTSGLFQTPLPLSDSNESIMLDLFGASRTINIRGIYTGTVAEINTFVQALDGLLNGSQNTKTFHSDKSNASYLVLINSVRWNSEDGAVTKVDYEIEMVEGSF